MTVRQNEPLYGQALAAGGKTEALIIQGQRISINAIAGGYNTLKVSIDGGPYSLIAPGYPINTGMETFNRVQFWNDNAGAITFDAEIGWYERPDFRTNITTMPAVEAKVPNTITTGGAVTVNAGSYADIAASSTRKELILTNKDTTLDLIMRDTSATTAIGTPLSAGQTAFLATSAALRLVNAGGSNVTVHYNELKVT